MSCMEHVCTKCGHMTFNNNFQLVCPKCQSTDIISHWDEQGDYERDYDQEDNDDE
jgi:predicted  nucleic acid-binding Zn-ribbon protein